jgi:hypothetical protein
MSRFPTITTLRKSAMTAIFTTCSNSVDELLIPTFCLAMNQPLKQPENAINGILSARMRSGAAQRSSLKKVVAIKSAPKSIKTVAIALIIAEASRLFFIKRSASPSLR